MRFPITRHNGQIFGDIEISNCPSNVDFTTCRLTGLAAPSPVPIGWIASHHAASAPAGNRLTSSFFQTSWSQIV